jgi:hypothetical protein
MTKGVVDVGGTNGLRYALLMLGKMWLKDGVKEKKLTNEFGHLVLY